MLWDLPRGYPARLHGGAFCRGIAVGMEYRQGVAACIFRILEIRWQNTGDFDKTR